eukprot:2491525-Rhodomonas_salina.1
MHAAIDEDTVFVFHTEIGTLICVTFVDDIIVCYTCNRVYNEFLAHMRTRFDTNDEGDLEWYLVVRYSHSNDGDTLTASQASYIQRLGETYGGEKWNSIRTPMEEKFNITPQELPTTKNLELETEYHKLLGSILFVSCWSRPDVSFAINHLARFATCPTDKTWKALKRVLRYLVATKDRGISWTLSPTSLGRIGHGRGKLYAYIDAAYADCSITRKSTMGY